MAKGTIGVTTDNIFPVIKKFLYSDHEIFLREIVSNAVDATQKLRTCASKGDYKGELGDLKVEVLFDEKAGTLTVRDHGIGMTGEEIEKYINQIAFSGVTDFLDKYKDDANAIIGHFGLGFYSAFMVAKEVEIKTLSYKEGAKGMHWTCDGSPEFDLSEDDTKTERGTDIILHIDDDCKEFLEKNRIQTLLTKYCKFLPVPIVFGKKTEWKDGKQVDTEEDNVVNNTNPLWTRKPTELKDEDYKKFYSELYPMSDEPLFWIHLNVDFPFHLTGVLYFPKIKSNIEIQRNKIQLYCNQVYVTDQVENIVPDFLTLLHGVIDSPDIPLNVSRSYLQSDANVKKISTYITKKVCDRLSGIFKNNRKDFEEKWDDLKLFIHYGMLSQPDFYDKAKDFALLKDVNGNCYTYDDYKTLIKTNQTDKDGNLICLYATDKDAQYSFIHSAEAKAYNVLLLDGQLDSPLVGMLEQKWEKTRFSRVDGDTVDKLIVKEDAKKTQLGETETAILTNCFQSQLPKLDKTEFHVETAALGEADQPVIITQSEYMRRMKEMSQFQQGMSFYGEMPDMYNVVLNEEHPIVKNVLTTLQSNLGTSLDPIEAELKGLNARRTVLEKEQKDKKAEEITDAEKADLKKCQDDIAAEEKKKTDAYAKAAQGIDNLHQLIDLALLRNGLLKGADLDKFLKRSISLMK